MYDQITDLHPPFFIFILLLNFQTEVFKTEVIMYEKILPAIQAAQPKPGADNSFTVPRCLYSDQEYIVMENLATMGFALNDRKTGERKLTKI